jgi:hypothetical protein
MVSWVLDIPFSLGCLGIPGAGYRVPLDTSDGIPGAG